jgi:threonine dehydrogenase-like Zn-dependent dehydrogenase
MTMKEKMKGFAMLDLGKTGWVEKPVPTLGPYDALVRPLVVAPCTSDIHTVYEGAFPRELCDFPRILGHEAVGEVVKVGEKVRDFKPGDRVAVPAITPDWRTLDVQRGYHQHSGGMLAGWKFSNPLKNGGKDGVFAEYFHVNDADMNLAKIPEGVSLEQAVFATDMMTTGFHGAELADIPLGGTVAVFGIGPVGLMAVAGAKLLGAARIIAVGSRPRLIELARYYGATDIVNYKRENPVQKILELTNGEGVDSAIIAGGDSSVIADAVKVVKPGGTIGNVNYFGTGDYLPIPRIEWGVGMAHKTIRGGLCPGGRLRMERLLALIKYGRVDPSKMISHRLKGFDAIPEAFELMRRKDLPDLCKPIVVIEE